MIHKKLTALIRLSLFTIMVVTGTGMTFSQTTVVDVIAGSENHNTLEAAVIAAQLADDLSGAGPFTVFAPTDAAFEMLPEGTVETLLEDPTGDLAQILLYHVYGGEAMSGDLTNGMMITTLNGDMVTVTIQEDGVYINNAKVSTADIEADNGVVHVIDAVITSTTTGIEDRVAEASDVSIFPNPANSFVNVRFEVTQPANITIELYDMIGQQVGYQDQGYTIEGNYTVEFPVSEVDPGMYIIIVNTGNVQIANKIKIVK